VKSQVGVGSTFTFTLRCAVANELILIVEDDEKSRKLVRDVLTFKGYEIVEAETGGRRCPPRQERRPSSSTEWTFGCLGSMGSRPSGGCEPRLPLEGFPLWR